MMCFFTSRERERERERERVALLRNFHIVTDVFLVVFLNKWTKFNYVDIRELSILNNIQQFIVVLLQDNEDINTFELLLL